MFSMSFNALSVALNNITTANSFSTGILGKELDSQKQMGQAIAKTISEAPAPSLERMVNPSIGGNIDLYV
jgi:hypothetical protein